MTDPNQISCPWSNFTPAKAAFCEESLCSWIRQPGNTWSNIGFILVALILFKKIKRDNAQHLLAIPYIALVTGLGSAFFHASETAWGGMADYVGIYLGAAYMLGSNLRRLFNWKRNAVLSIGMVSFSTSLVLMHLNDSAARMIYGLESSICCVIIELIIYFKRGKTIQYKFLFAYWTTFLLALGIWWLDLTKTWCKPTDHLISGHAIWHLLDAISLYFFYQYYVQFKSLRFEPHQSLHS